MKRLLVIGAGGHGRVVADTALCTGLWGDIGFLDDRLAPSTDVGGIGRVAGPVSELESLLRGFDDLIIAIGDNMTRDNLTRRARSLGAALAVIVHPRAWVSSHAKLGAGTVVCAGAAVNHGAVIHESVIINTGATVDHDCVIHGAVHISPGANISGTVTLGKRVWIGTGASVKHGIAIGDDTVVGVGAAVVEDLPGGVTAVGVPARIIKGAQ